MRFPFSSVIIYATLGYYTSDAVRCYGCDVDTIIYFILFIYLVFLVISLVFYRDTDIEALVPASVSHHCLVLS